MQTLENKVAYITGGSKGIGLGIAKKLSEAGMRVAITSRHINEAKKAAQSLSNDESKILAIESDVTSLESQTQAIKKVVDHFGQLDVLIANAGIGHFASIEDLTPEIWKQTIDTNLTGVFNSVKASLPEIKKSKGYIITIGSLAGINFFENGSAYNASKFGIVGFSQAIMLDLRKHDIKVTTIMPGSVATNFNDHDVTDKDSWKIQPEDIGEMVVNLLNMHPRTLPSKVEVRPLKPVK
jgi:NAD(P)-dependent dehydrogenase (short-subunit alcohol dehydrogenase family)